MKLRKFFIVILIFLMISGVYAEKSASFNNQVITISKQALLQYLKYGDISRGLINQTPTAIKTEKNQGVFVTFTKDGVVRGCMGTVFPKSAALKEEIIKSTILAASADTRYPRITMEEYPFIKYHISLVKNVKYVGTGRGLSVQNPKKFGLLVISGKRGGVLLPGEAKTAEWQVYECKRKAGIKQTAPVVMYVFETDVIGD